MFTISQPFIKRRWYFIFNRFIRIEFSWLSFFFKNKSIAFDTMIGTKATYFYFIVIHQYCFFCYGMKMEFIRKICFCHLQLQLDDLLELRWAKYMQILLMA